MGSPTYTTQLSEALIDAICAHLQAGNTKRASCNACEVSEHTLMRWQREANKHREALERGELDPDKLTQRQRMELLLLQRMELAQANAALQSVAVVRSAAANGNWQAAAWWLERRTPKEWAKRLQFEDISDSKEAVPLRDLITGMVTRTVGAIEGTKQALTDGSDDGGRADEGMDATQLPSDAIEAVPDDT